jgi:hypothetical protein
MRSRILVGIALILVSLSTSVAPAAWGVHRSHLATLAAKQALCDEVCVAMSKGYLTLSDRAEILADARKALTAEEYPAFKRALDQIVPSPNAAPKYTAQVKPSPNAASKHTTQVKPSLPTRAAPPNYYASKPAERPATLPVAGQPATPVQTVPQKPPVLIEPQPAAPSPPKHGLPSDGPVIPTTALEPEPHVAGS